MNKADQFLKDHFGPPPVPENVSREGQKNSFVEEDRGIGDPEPDLPGRQRTVTLSEAWTFFWSRWTFSGRSSRSEYWKMLLIVSLINMAIGMLSVANAHLHEAVQVISWLWSLAVLIPNLALICRRFHDIGKSGWCYLLALIPILGQIAFIYWMAQPSEPRSNQYGEVPNVD